MAVFVVFVCAFSKWILMRRRANGAAETAHGGQPAVAVEPVKGHGGK
jgi:hypothetical protein